MRSTQRRDLSSSMSRPTDAERCFPSHSPYSSTLDRPPRAARARDGRLRGGALEPGACASDEKGIGKPRLKLSMSFSAPPGRMGPYLPRAGPRFDLGFLQAEHHLPELYFGHETKKATRLGRPRLACYAASELARTPPDEGQAGPALALFDGGAIRPLQRRRRRRRVGKP